MAQHRIISADSHFVEPPNMWTERIDKKFRDRAPHTQSGHNGMEGEFFICENIQPVPGGGLLRFWQNRRRIAGALQTWLRRCAEKRMGPCRASERAGPRRRRGRGALHLNGELLFGLDDAELRSACFRGFNDWAAEYCSYNPQRLIGLGTLELSDISAAVKELERCAKVGIRGVLIWGAPPEDKPYGHPDYDPFWAAAQELEMPLSLHTLTERRAASRSIAPTYCGDTCRCRTRFKSPLLIW